MSQPVSKKRVQTILTTLREAYPDVKTALKYKTPLEMLIATILSAQCTDVRVNEVTKTLFEKLRTTRDYARISLPELEALIRPTGFFRNKAKNIQACCRTLVEKHGGKIPANMQDLVALPGIGRKTANVILGSAFGIPGIVVDTHVKRLSQRIGLTKEKDPVKIEFDLMPIIPKKDWIDFSHQLIWHGRKVCTARKPRCLGCPLLALCDYGQSNTGPRPLV